MSTYKLLTPGPLSTSKTVKEAMMQDACTWDKSYKEMTQSIREELLQIADVSSEDYTTVLMQGSGSYVVESVLTTTIKSYEKALFITNGAYGERMIQMAEALKINHTVYRTEVNDLPSSLGVESLLQNDPAITHIVMVHCETTTGILNPIAAVGEMAKIYEKTFIVDAMSSFGGVPIDMQNADIDYLISSANKCIEGVPGFGFAICKRDKLKQCKGNAGSVALDMYAQWEVMDIDGKWRFTSPTHAVLAFHQAIQELKAEGVDARHIRYQENNRFVREELRGIGIEAYIDEAYQSPIIATYLFPSDTFDFEGFYEAMKQKGFIIYPGKLTEVDTFRIGNIGQVHQEDFARFCGSVKQYMMGEIVHA